MSRSPLKRDTEALPGTLRLVFRVLCLALFFYGGSAHAATYYSRTSGVFATANTWSTSPTGTPVNGTAIGNGDIFIIQSSHVVTVGASRTVAQVTVNSGGTLALATFVLTVSGAWTNNGTISGSTGRMTASTGTLTNNGVINFTGAGGLVKTTGVLTNGASGTINVTGAGTITMGTGNFQNLNTSSAVNFGASVLTITGTTASQSIGGFVSTGRLACTKTGGTLTLAGDVTCGGITVNGLGGTLNLGTGWEHTSTGQVTLSLGTLNGGSSTLYVMAASTQAWRGTGTNFTPSTSTVVFGAAGNQTLSASGTKTFYNLVYASSGNKNTSTGTTVVNNILSIEDAALATGTTVTYGTNAGLLYNNATTRNAGAEWLTPFAATAGVTISTTGTITLPENKTFNSGTVFTIKPGGVFNAANFDMVFNGDFVNDGTWTGNTGDVTVTGTTTQNIGGFSTTGLFLMSKTGGTATLTGDINTGSFILNGTGGTLDLGNATTMVCAGIFTSTAGTINASNSTLVFDNALVLSGGTFNTGTGTAHFRGSGAQVIPGIDWYNLICSNVGAKSFSGNTNVLNVLTVNSGVTLNVGSILLQLSGTGTPFVNNGTVNTGTSTIGYAGSGTQTIIPLNYYNLAANVNGGARVLSTAGNIGIAGSFTPGTAPFTVAGSTIDFNGVADQVIPAFSFHKLIVSNNGIKKIMASITVECQTIDINDAASVEIDADGSGALKVLQ